MSCLLIGPDDGRWHSTPRYKLTAPSLDSGLLVCRHRCAFDKPAAWFGAAASQKRLGPCKLDNIPQHRSTTSHSKTDWIAITMFMHKTAEAENFLCADCAAQCIRHYKPCQLMYHTQSLLFMAAWPFHCSLACLLNQSALPAVPVPAVLYQAQCIQSLEISKLLLHNMHYGNKTHGRAGCSWITSKHAWYVQVQHRRHLPAAWHHRKTGKIQQASTGLSSLRRISSSCTAVVLAAAATFL